MTVADNTSRNQYTATSGQTVFAYTFEIVDKGDIVVLQNGTTLSEGTNYTVSNVGNDSGGNVTLTVGATTGDILTLYRDMPYARTQNYTNSGDFLASEVNSDFDNLWLAGEQTNRSFSQSIRKPITDSDSISMELPEAADRANKYLSFSSTGAVAVQQVTPATDASAVTYTPAGTGAVDTTVQAKLRETISVKDFGAVGDGVTDDTTAIQAALDYAGSLSIPDSSFPGYGYVVKGGGTVYLPAGQYLTSSVLTVPQNVSFEGAGKYSTVIRPTGNEAVIRNDGFPTGTGTYDVAGMAFRNFSILGDRTKAAQIGLAFLRLTSATIENVSISRCGYVGVAMYQCGVNQVNNLECISNGDHGLYIASGFDTWGGSANNLPSNANVFTFYRGLQNEGAGIYFANGTNGNIFVGANCEYNHYSAGNNVGYNVHVATNSYSPNCFYGLWTEGPVQAHVYVASSDISVFVKLIDWKHFGDGTSGSVDRALILNTGSATVQNATATATSYKTISGSNAPFRIQNKSTSFLQLLNVGGATVSGIDFVEDATGAKTGLFNNLRQDNSGSIQGAIYGPQTFYNDGSAGDGVAYRRDNQSYAWYQARAFQRDILLGDGSAAPDAGFQRLAAGQIGPISGDFFNVGSQWDGSHLIMGSYHLWVDATGDLRIKSSAPSGDTDGDVVGTQS